MALACGTTLIFAASVARADVTISDEPTSNMSCTQGVCVPIASAAVLNVDDLRTLLAAGNVRVTTAGSSAQANNIDVTAKLGWSAHILTLDAFQSLSVAAPITVKGKGKGKEGLAILINDGGTGGELGFFGKGHVIFQNLSSSLSINGTSYMLENSVASLAVAIRRSPAGAFALSTDIVAGYSSHSPIKTPLTGTFEGLGNKISSATIQSKNYPLQEAIGFFAVVNVTGILRDVGLIDVKITVGSGPGTMGGLVGRNYGTVFRSYATGTIRGSGASEGGLVGYNYGGLIYQCFAKVHVKTVNDQNGKGSGGGLVGWNAGRIVESYATGDVNNLYGNSSDFGGLAGGSRGARAVISDSYSTGSVTTGSGVAGGLVGYNQIAITSSYSIGMPDGQVGVTGGLIGDDVSPTGSLSSTYWDTDTSGIANLSQGAGTPANDPGIAGLSTVQLQTGLPAGFDPSVWAYDAGINGGLPYLIANPPQ
jgi:hypothetical protein